MFRANKLDTWVKSKDPELVWDFWNLYNVRASMCIDAMKVSIEYRLYRSKSSYDPQKVDHHTPVSLVQGGKRCLSYLSSQHKPALLLSMALQPATVTWGRICDLVLCWPILIHRVHLSCIKPHNLLLNSFFHVMCIFLSCRIRFCYFYSSSQKWHDPFLLTVLMCFPKYKR